MDTENNELQIEQNTNDSKLDKNTESIEKKDTAPKEKPRFFAGVRGRIIRFALVILMLMIVVSYFYYTENMKGLNKNPIPGQSDTTSQNKNTDSPQQNKDTSPQTFQDEDLPPTENLEELFSRPIEHKLSTLPEGFPLYQENTVSVNPKVPAYSVNSTMDNIINKEEFTFSPKARELLLKNYFVVVPASEKEFFPLYERNQYSRVPSFVTTDSMLHNYHLMFNDILENLEKEKLAPELNYLNKSMIAESQKQYDALKGTAWENSAKRNLGFFTVGSLLLNPDTTVAAVIKSEVDAELALIEAHSGIAEAVVMNIGTEADTYITTPQGTLPLENLKEDYSQYIPRGHYDKSELLKRYFKSMMWYGRLTFRFKNEDEIKSALLITHALNQNKNNISWNILYEPINFFVGKSDDITYYQFNTIFKTIYGTEPTLQTIVGDNAKFEKLVEEISKLTPPQVNSIPVFEAKFQPDRTKEILGFRFLGQKFTIDASIFQRLMYREVGNKSTMCTNYDPTKTGCLDGARCLPKGLDIPAAFGSSEALKILTDLGETKYACYSENLAKTKNHLVNLDKATWTQNLYWGWLYSLLPLTTEKVGNYPMFMKSQPWLHKELNTFLGSWTELKHDTLLYAKQAYAELGGGGAPEKDFRGYVEPNPHVYGRLASLIAMTREGLKLRELLNEKTQDQLDVMEKLALSLKLISEKELNNENLTKDEHDLIKSFGGQLEHLWIDIYDRNIIDDETSAPLVADVATDPNGKVLEVATGYISEIYVIVPVEGKLRIAKGGVFSYYEFPWDMSDRLTDTKWKDMLSKKSAPPLPSWTNSFTAIEK